MASMGVNTRCTSTPRQSVCVSATASARVPVSTWSLRSGANTLLTTMHTTIGTLSQRFRKSTRRRYRLKNESPSSPVTPESKSRNLLGRTPTKLYSPFGIETPCKKIRGKENANGSIQHNTPRLRSGNKNHKGKESSHPKAEGQPKCQYEVRHQHHCDVEEVKVGVWELRQTAQHIVRRSLHH